MTSMQKEFEKFIAENLPGYIPQKVRDDLKDFVFIKMAFEAGWQAGGGGDK